MSNIIVVQKTLEDDLEIAERKKKERAFAVKYHKVKFFGALPTAVPAARVSHVLNFLYREEESTSED